MHNQITFIVIFLLYILVHACVLGRKWLKCCFTVTGISLIDMDAQINELTSKQKVCCFEDKMLD